MSLISLWIHSNVYINKNGDIFQNFESLTIFIHWNPYLTNLDYPRRLPSIHIDFVLSQPTPNASLWSKCNSLQVSLHASLISLLWCHCFAAPSSQPIICGTWIDCWSHAFSRAWVRLHVLLWRVFISSLWYLSYNWLVVSWLLLPM